MNTTINNIELKETKAQTRCKLDPGVYIIKNLINGKEYVGSTLYLSGRRNSHFNKMRTKTHPNILLQNGYNKYGEKAFEFRIVLRGPEDYCREMEQKFIDTGDFVYNIATEVGKINKNFSPVLQYDLQGNFIKEFPSKTLASRETGALINSICETCSGINFSSKGFIWRNKTENYSLKIDVPDRAFALEKAERAAWRKTEYIIYEWDWDSNVTNTYTDIVLLAKKLNVTGSFLYNHIQELEKVTTLNGKVYTLKNTPPLVISAGSRVVLQLDVEGNIIKKYKLSIEGLREYNFSRDNISNAANFRNGTNKAYGYFWKFDDGKLFTPVVLKDGSRKKVEKVSLEGEVLETYRSALLAYNSNGIKRNKVKIDPIKIFSNFTLRYKDED